MQGLLGFIRSFDLFGASVNVNFRGQSDYKTGVGALMTLLIRSFMLFYAVRCAIQVLDYEDPSINSYEIKDERIDMEPMNLGAHNFDMIFSIIDSKTWTPVKLDPRYGKFMLM